MSRVSEGSRRKRRTRGGGEERGRHHHGTRGSDDEEEIDHDLDGINVIDFGPAGSNVSNNYDLHKSQYRFKYITDCPMMCWKEDPSYRFLVAKVGKVYAIRSSLNRSVMRYLCNLPKVYTKLTVDFVDKAMHIKRDKLLSQFKSEHQCELLTATSSTAVDTVDPASVEMVWSDMSPECSRKFSFHFRIHGSSMQFGHEVTSKLAVVRHVPMRLILEVWADLPSKGGYVECHLIDCCTIDLACFGFGSTTLLQVMPQLCDYTPQAWNELPISRGLNDIKCPNFRSPLIGILNSVSPDPLEIIDPNPNLYNSIISVVLVAPQSDSTRQHIKGQQFPAMIVRGETHKVLLHKFHLYRDEPLRVCFHLVLNEPEADLKDPYYGQLNNRNFEDRALLSLDTHFTDMDDKLIDYKLSSNDRGLMVLWDSTEDISFGLRFNVPEIATNRIMKHSRHSGKFHDADLEESFDVDIALGSFHRIRYNLIATIHTTTTNERICTYDLPVEIYDKPDYLLNRLLGERWSFCKDQPEVAQYINVMQAPVSKYIELTAREFFFEPKKDDKEFETHFPLVERVTSDYPSYHPSVTIGMIPLQPSLEPLVERMPPYLTPPLSNDGDDTESTDTSSDRDNANNNNNHHHHQHHHHNSQQRQQHHHHHHHPSQHHRSR